MFANARWYVYQRERFPIVGNGALILAFSSGAVCFSAQLRATRDGVPSTLNASSLVVAFICAFLFFYLLRVSDEHKDLEDDTRWRPYRPVPRGLVTLSELRISAFAAMILQAVLAFTLEPRLVGVLLMVWAYIGVMTKEFWLHDYLRKHPVVTLWSHMLIIPLIDLYATACDWMTQPGGVTMARSALFWFLCASFTNGIVVEIGRKIRSPSDEEEGVETYSKLWGPSRSLTVWIGAMLVTAGFAIAAATHIQSVTLVTTVLLVVLALAIGAGIRLLRNRVNGAGKSVEIMAGIWTLALYISVGVAPFVLSR